MKTKRPGRTSRPPARPTLADERRRLVAAQARRTELRNATDAGDLLSVSEVVAAWSEILGVVKQRLLALPTSLAPELARENDAHAVHARLEQAVRDCLQALSEWRPPDHPKGEKPRNERHEDP